jgi:hypothetical protein
VVGIVRKKHLRRLTPQEAVESRNEHRQMENHHNDGCHATYLLNNKRGHFRATYNPL